jgi:hypothetical protein
MIVNLESAKTLVDIFVGSLTIVAAPFAAYKALKEWGRSIEQRKEELKLRQREFRHRQAVFARDLMKEVFQDKRARSALRMLDWLRTEYQDESGEKYVVRRSEVQHALRTTREVCSGKEALSDKEEFIRNCFERLYDYWEQIEELIKLEVVNFEDLETVFRYYVLHILRPDVWHPGFLETYDYPRARGFISRFEKDSS